MLSLKRAIQLAFILAVPAACAPSSHSRGASYVSTLPKNSQSLFRESMDWLDGFYDPAAGYLFDESSATALRHETRSSAWYAVGLLARNENDDVKNALQIITNVIDGQYKDPKDQWYGDYQKEPEEPTVGTAAYPENIYSSWDPNWRGFIGTCFIVGLEEFGHLIPPEVTSLLEKSLYNATRGDKYRVGGVDKDNLYPAYTNPEVTHASFCVGLDRASLNDSNMTISGENYATAVIDLFNRANTLSEFNSGTYTGVSLYALTLWAKYLPDDSVMKQDGARIVQYTWEAVAELWQPQLQNVAGPWDRSYGFDMNRYLSLLALHLWNVIGKEKSSIIPKTAAMAHVADWAYGPQFAILSAFYSTLMPSAVVENLNNFQGEYTFTSSAFSPQFDIYLHNITAWLAPNISIGAESFNETTIGGPAIDPGTFNPAIIQWNTGNEIGYITWYATEHGLTAVASPNSLNLSYPYGTANSIFSIIVGTFKKARDVTSWDDAQGLSVKVSGNVNMTFSLGFAGENGGAYSTINDFEF